MWRLGWRDRVWESLDQTFDLIVIGGGITGAGIFLEASRQGLKTLLLEAADFASGTSSRSSKLVHGGFRYLRNGQIKITYDSVRERERLLKDQRGLINELGFIIASYKGDRIPMWVLGAGLSVYDLLAFKWGHKYYQPDRILDLCSCLNAQDLRGGYRYFDALTDDARLVLKTIKLGVEIGSIALNYARVEKILRTTNHQTAGVAIRDMSPERNPRTEEVRARAVINATGAWAEDVLDIASSASSRTRKLRLLRGSHLVFSQATLPLTRAISIWHPRDKRPVFAFPWEGVTLVGTTDVDSKEAISTNPSISPGEIEYLLEFVQFAFPGLELDEDDIQSTYSGYRSVIDTGKVDPSKESREYFFWYDNGCLTVAGGKLTTFHLVAIQALEHIRKRINGWEVTQEHTKPANPPSISLFVDSPIETRTGIRMIGRYGNELIPMVNEVDENEFQPIESSINLWAEIRWAARTEGIIHLEDLLLRRVRLANLLPRGGFEVLDRIKKIVIEELNWEDWRWVEEINRYRSLLGKSYSLKVSPADES
ncbi:MAG: glycerol-3-phosphate dehydrogenase/oxidase [Anaerolineales bacterium]|jgi:glycerol-3-phosphate dehydrogenase